MQISRSRISSWSRKVAITGTLALVFGLAACSSATPQASGEGDAPSNEVFEWDFVTYNTAQSEGGKDAQEFFDAVEEATDGRLKITPHWSGELPYAPTDFVEVIADGSVDMADLGSGFLAGTAPLSIVSNLPMLAPDAEEFFAVMDSPFYDLVVEDFRSHGVDILWWYPYAFQTIVGSGEPPRDVDDLKGRLVRAADPITGHFVSGLGLSPVTVTTAEVATALQTGTVEAAVTSAGGTYNFGWAEYLDWIYLSEANKTTNYVGVNPDSLAALPDDLREILLEVSAEQMTPEILARPDERDAEYRKKLVDEYDIEFIEPSDADREVMTEIMEPYWHQWAEENNAVEGLELALEAVQEVRG